MKGRVDWGLVEAFIPSQAGAKGPRCLLMQPLSLLVRKHRVQRAGSCLRSHGFLVIELRIQGFSEQDSQVGMMLGEGDCCLM